MTGVELLTGDTHYVSWNMRVVFYTAYDKYMIQAIREAAFDYLLKPFDERDLKEILTRFTQQVETGAAGIVSDRESYAYRTDFHRFYSD